MAKKLTGTEGVDFVVCQVCGRRFGQITASHLKFHNITIEKYKELYPNIKLQCENILKIKIENKNKIDNKIENEDYVICQICGGKFENLSSHLTRSHKMSKEEYLKLYPDSLLISNKLKLSTSKNTLKQWENGKCKGFMVNENIDKFVEDNIGKHFCHCGCNREIIIERRYYNSGIPEYIIGHHMKTEEYKDNHSKDNIERLSKLTKEELMELTFGMRSHWTPDRKEENNQWQRDRWTSEMRVDKSEMRIQYYIDHPEAREEAAIKSNKYHKNNLETFIERGKLISAGHQGISREDWDHFIWEENDWRDWSKAVYLNDWFKGCHRHHITKTIVICVPSELHIHIPHNLKTGKGMGEMNMLALQFINGCYNE